MQRWQERYRDSCPFQFQWRATHGGEEAVLAL